MCNDCRCIVSVYNWSEIEYRRAREPTARIQIRHIVEKWIETKINRVVSAIDNDSRPRPGLAIAGRGQGQASASSSSASCDTPVHFSGSFPARLINIYELQCVNVIGDTNRKFARGTLSHSTHEEEISLSFAQRYAGAKLFRRFEKFSLLFYLSALCGLHIVLWSPITPNRRVCEKNSVDSVARAWPKSVREIAMHFFGGSRTSFEKSPAAFESGEIAPETRIFRKRVAQWARYRRIFPLIRRSIIDRIFAPRCVTMGNERFSETADGRARTGHATFARRGKRKWFRASRGRRTRTSSTGTPLFSAAGKTAGFVTGDKARHVCVCFERIFTWFPAISVRWSLRGDCL